MRNLGNPASALAGALALSLSLTTILLPTTASAAVPKNAILLSDVQSLTLRANQQTSHRRVPSIPQLKCVSGRALCALHEIDTMRCVNQGSGYSSEDIQWACTANLPSTLKLGSTDVICEGYASSDDPYVLKGSCGVEYRLVLTDEGERRHPDLPGGSSTSRDDWAGYIFMVIFVCVLGWIIYSGCTQAAENNRRQPPAGGPRRRPPGNGWGGGGGGGWNPGGGGPFDDPPPPYPGTKPSSSSAAAGGGEQGWRPGFWSGLAGGAAAGYLAGNRGGGGRQSNNNNANYGGGGAWGGDTGNYGSTWGSGRRSGGSSSSSGSQHESTGFGSTSRR
ncbi:transmembrane protein [Podospora didyma]|uniref:Store-operated calcium entry-associated regulatory factor n=1 Tax=Podospora didyma TaxID=330526 RepID=A0AAE0KEN1_9PEZI|nr:transmembrane protein [Podospora didyma]